MSIFYRILSLIINAIAMMLAISFVCSLPVIFSSAQTLFPGFIMVAVILYAWFSSRFRLFVLQRHETVRPGLRDLIRVNGFVAMFFSVISILGMFPLIMNPQPLLDATHSMGVDIPVKTATSLIAFMLVFGVALLVHIIWTFILIKKNIEFFQQPDDYLQH